MKRLAIITLLLAAAAFPAEAVKPTRWKAVHEKTSCEAVAPGSCIGEYGFTVDAAGRFTAGPSPKGIHVDGQLTSSELTELQAAVGQALRHARKPESCVPSRNIPGSSARLTVTSIGGREQVIFRRESPSQLCFRGRRATATHLRDVMQRLMAEHYPQHFPD